MIKKIFFSLLLPLIVHGALFAKDWQNIQEELRNAVVRIPIVIKNFNWFNPYINGNTKQSWVTGFFIDQHGTIMTCSHAIQDAISVFITIPSFGKQFFKAHVIGLCPEHDVALLQLDEESLAIIRKKSCHIPHLTLGDSDCVKRGEEVLALGYPGTTIETEQLKGSAGVISARLNRVFQTDIAINPGNSGGPVLDQNGNVVGITISFMKDAQNCNFAVPINTAKALMQNFHEHKLIRLQSLPIVWSYTTAEIRKYLNLTDQEGCLVCDVLDETSNFQIHDIIHKIDGYFVDNYGEIRCLVDGDAIRFDHYISQQPSGTTIVFDIYRNGQLMQLSMIIEQGVEKPIPTKYPVYEKIDYEVFAGLIIMPLTTNYIGMAKERPGLQRYLTNFYCQEQRLVIANLIPDSEIACNKIIKWGDTINEVNDEKVYTLDDFRQALQKSIETGIVTITTTDELRLSSEKYFHVLALSESCEETVTLAQLHGYPISEMVMELMR